jgi:hypothetical protein
MREVNEAGFLLFRWMQVDRCCALCHDLRLPINGSRA